MCGRYLLRADTRLLERAFGITEFSETPRDLARFNIAPSQSVAIVRNRPGRELTIIRRADGSAERELVSVRWGLIPAWAKDPSIGNRMINARAEGVSDKPSFRAAFRSRRCIVPASGFYEWQRQGRGPSSPTSSGARTGSRWALPAYGSVGTTARVARRSRPARSSPARRTSSWPSSTTACR
jgi:putative SOS response-associated peptidase YedK